MSKTREPGRAGVKWPIVGGGFVAASIVALIALKTNTSSPERVSVAAGTADSLIALWIDSVGGMDRYNDFQSSSFTISTLLYDTLSGRLKRDRPRYAWIKKGPNGEETRVERWETEGFIAQGFNGIASWATLDGALLPDSAKDSREALYVARDLFYWMGLPYKLRDPGVVLTYRGMTSRPGMEMRADPTAPAQPASENGYHTVAVNFDVGVGEHQDAFTYYFEPGKAFPVEVNYVEEGRTDINRLLWGQTGWADGLRYPYQSRRDFITASGKLTKALTIDAVVMNPDIPQTRFEHAGS